MGLVRNCILAGAAAAALMMGCGNPQQVRNSSASGSLALSTDDALLYAADTDNGVVSVIDTKSDSKLYDVKVGARPMRVAVGADDTLYVANRGSRSVSVIRKGERNVATEIATGVDPTGMAVSFDGKTLYVVSATAKDTADYGVLQAIDTETLEVKYEKPVGYEPRSIALVSNTKALITQYKGADKGADVAEVNLTTGEVTNAGSTGLYDRVNFSKNGGSGSGFGGTVSSFKARAMADVVVSPDGTRAFVPTVWAREDAIGRRPSSSGGYYSAGGPCSVGAVATAGIVTMDVGANGSAAPRVDDLTDCVSRGQNVNTDVDYPPTAVSVSSGSPSGTGAEGVQGPVAAAMDPTGEWVYVVNKETSNVAVMPAWRRQGVDGEKIDFSTTGNSIRSLVSVNTNIGLNSGSDGIAITKDGLRAYVYNQFDHTVTKLGNDKVSEGQKTGGPKSQVIKLATISLGLSDTLPQDAVVGRRLFFDAQSTVMSSAQTHVACSTCHLEGRDDGHVWSFPDGKRQTPTLVGRATSQTAPLHWNAEFKDFTAFMNHTVVSRMGGSGTNPVSNAQILTWLDSEPAAENAHQGASLNEKQTRGKAAFGKAACNSCHLGENLTNLKAANVGTAEAGVTDFDTPSLKGLARSAPYMHDGRFSTLLDRVAGSGVEHGDLSKLSTEEKVDLVEYLKTL